MLTRLLQCLILISFCAPPLAVPAPGVAAEPVWIFGVHDAGGYSKIEQAGKRGWLVVTVEIGRDPNNKSGDDFSFYSNRGHGVIVRINHGYGSNGTLPYQSQYHNFATRCANYVSATKGADIFIIGNETNLPREWPGNIDGNAATGEPITVARYIDCYNRCYTAIKAVKPAAQVCPSPSGTWAPPYPTQGIEGFLDYWVNTLNGIGADKIDALILHAYTHGCDPALVTSDAKMGYPYTNIFYHFRVYRNYMAAVPSSMRTKPVYITECDQNIECADPPPNPRNTWYNVNNGWMKAIYSEINSWNLAPTNQKIRCVAMFRWDNASEGEWTFCFSTRQNVVTDWVEAMANEYRWDVGAKGTLWGYVRDTSNQPIAGAVVTTSPGAYTARSAANGEYKIENVDPGTYSLTATKTGYAQQTIANRVVNAGATTAVSFSLTPMPVLGITSVSSPVSAVKCGQGGIPVSMNLQNSSTEDLRIEAAYPTFRQGAVDVSSGYTVAPAAANPRIIPRWGSVTLDFTVTVNPGAPHGDTTIDGYALAWPNAVPNGSFEEGGASIPPTHWVNWTNVANAGASWDYDSAVKFLGERSYKLGLTNAPNNLYCTCDTGADADLLPVLPSTQYRNSLMRRTSVTLGSIVAALVFSEYDINKVQIGYDKWLNFTTSADWQEASTTYTTSSNAEFARVWVKMRAVGTTTASLWIDDVQLKPVGMSYTNSSAQIRDAWNVAVSAPTISEAKELPDGTLVALASKRVTAKFGTSFYVEEQDRSSGVKVDGATTAAIGDTIDVMGVLATTGGERRIAAYGGS